MRALVAFPSLPALLSFISLALLACSASDDSLGAAEASIVDGRAMGDAEHAASPLVHLRIAGDSFCSGALIGDRTVLTAAHCLRSPLRNVLVTYPSPQGAPITEPFAIAEAAHHPKFPMVWPQDHADVLKIIQYDVALVRLQEVVPATKPRAALLPRVDHGWLSSRSSSEVTLMGYGATSEMATRNAARKPYAGTAHVADPMTIEEALVGEPVAIAFDIPDHEALVVDFSRGAQMCYGDSGGPLFVRRGSAPFVVAAVNSWILDATAARRTCNRGSVHPTVSAPENAAFLEPLRAAYETSD